MAVTELREPCTGTDTSTSPAMLCFQQSSRQQLCPALSQQVVGMFRQMFPAPGPHPKPPSEVPVPLKRILLPVHVFFHN